MDICSFIRNAQIEDSYYVSQLLVQAMDDLSRFFTSNAGYNEEINLFDTFFKLRNNQYSFENTIIFEKNGKILGSSNGYDGGKLKDLRESFLNYVKLKYNVEFPISDDETESGEFYIDCISVFPEEQGKGIGTQLLMTMIEKGRLLNFKKAGLLVDIHNPKAKRLYERIGFEKKGEKFFMCSVYDHMQLSLI